MQSSWHDLSQRRYNMSIVTGTYTRLESRLDTLEEPSSAWKLESCTSAFAAGIQLIQLISYDLHSQKSKF